MTHVCRYWRESIISAPEHWARISSRNEKMAAVSLERAKAVPLKISLFMPTAETYTSFPGVLVPYFRNTRSLAVWFPSNTDALTRMLPNFPQSMPNLRSLTIQGDFNRAGSIDLFKQSFPALEYLSLAGDPLHQSQSGLTTLAGFSIQDRQSDLHLDTLLSFLEANPSLEIVDLKVEFGKPSLRRSKRRSPMRNQLQRLTIRYGTVMDIQALASNIPLRTGAELKIYLERRGPKLGEVLDISTSHLSNPPGPTLLEIRQSHSLEFTLRGSGGALLVHKFFHRGESFIDLSELPLLLLANIREFRLLRVDKTLLKTLVFHLSHFPLLETLAIARRANLQRTLFALLTNPSSSPFLKTLAFLNCDLSENFMKELTKFAFERRSADITAWLDRVLIFHRDGVFPSDASISRLKSCVRIVNTRVASVFPENFT